MKKVFAVIDGQICIHQDLIEQAGRVIGGAVVMDPDTGELMIVESLADNAEEKLLEKIRKAAQEGDKAGYQDALESIRKALPSGRTQVESGKFTSAGIGAGVEFDLPDDALWNLKIGVSPQGILYCAGIGPAKSDACTGNDAKSGMVLSEYSTRG